VNDGNSIEQGIINVKFQPIKEGMTFVEAAHLQTSTRTRVVFTPQTHLQTSTRTCVVFAPQTQRTLT
jgi:hypothetical protein